MPDRTGMKSNHGPRGEPIVRLPDPVEWEMPAPWPPSRPPGRRRNALLWVAGALGAVLVVLGGIAIWALVAGYGDDDEPVTAVALTPTPAAAASATAAAATASPSTATSPTATPVASATATPRPTQTPTSAPTATPTPTPTATPSPTVTPTPTPAGPPLVRQRYTTVAGDSCDLIRQKFAFPARDADEFYTAMLRLSGKASCGVLRQAEVVCIPNRADVLAPNALGRDDACLAAP
ncbi:MAG: hypothetical protein ACKVVT_10515 [Dehalococcoidia bacterium]